MDKGKIVEDVKYGTTSKKGVAPKTPTVNSNTRLDHGNAKTLAQTTMRKNSGNKTSGNGASA